MTTKELINSITEIELDSNCKVVAAKGYGTAKDFQKQKDLFSELEIDNVSPVVSERTNAPHGSDCYTPTGDDILGG